MTARELVLEIFSRPQRGISADVRRITQRQYQELRRLFFLEVGKGRVRSGLGGALIWTSQDREEFTVRELSGSCQLARSKAPGVEGVMNLF